MDVLVVGGGPAGLATAILAARAGMAVTVAEPRTGPIDKACGEGLMPSALSRLLALGVDPPGRPLLGIRYVDAKHRADALFRGTQGRGVRRTALHAALAECAAKEGVTVVPARVTEFARHADHVEAAGMLARYLVAADGLHSPIRRICGLDPAPAAGAARPRFGLRRHYRLAPWTDLVEVHWSAQSEAYVTPVADDLIGVAILGPQRGDFDTRLAEFPALRERLVGAAADGSDRGAGPLRQDVRRRVSADRVLLVGDASGYVDALTGEGISVALAQAAALVGCLRTGRAEEYERRWRQVSRKSRALTSGLLWARGNPLLGHRIVPTAARLPRVFTAVVGQVAVG